MSATKILWGQILTVFMIVLFTTWAATQWTAWRLGFQAQLGPPWFDLAGWPIYYPWSFFPWWYFYDAYAPPIFVEGAYIAASGGFISIGVAIGMSVWRAREAKNVETYGSARWARADEVRAAGLLGADGVVLGKLDRDYLRHDGPEHVLCFAPTRSGKGVGLVVPSLLTWPGSAIVHDIKGENWDADSRLPLAARPRAAVRPDQSEIRRLQSATGGPERGMGGPRRAEHRRHPGRPGGFAREAEPLGEDEPRIACRCDPACPLCRGRQDAGRRRRLPLRSETPDRVDARRDDEDRAPRRGRAASRHRQRGARAAEQVGQRTQRRAQHRHVVPGPLSRSRCRRGHAPLRLAHHRHRRRQASDHALPRGAALRHQPHQAADPPDPQPDRPAP